MVLHGREELGLMSDEYGALTMVLLRFLAFPAPGSENRPRAAATAREPARAAPLRAPQPPAITLPAVPLPLPLPVSRAAPASAPSPTSAPAPAPAAPFVAAPAAPPWAVEAAAPAAVQAPAEPAARAPGPVAPASAPVDATLGERWYTLIKPLCEDGTLGALTRELALQGGLVAVDAAAEPPVWQLCVERETLRTPALRDKLAAVLAGALGHAVQLELQPGVPEDSPARRDAAERQRRQAAAEAAIQADPVVCELLAQFKTARIVPGSIKPL
jgi:DNA polymerase-3 subunit gamma/tau